MLPVSSLILEISKIYLTPNLYPDQQMICPFSVSFLKLHKMNNRLNASYFLPLQKF